MPKGFKSCPKCFKSAGPRTKVCECGYNFAFNSTKDKIKKKREKEKAEKLKGKVKKKRGRKREDDVDIGIQEKIAKLIDSEYIDIDDSKECGSCFILVPKNQPICNCGYRFEDLITKIENEAVESLKRVEPGDTIKVNGGPFYGPFEKRISMGEAGEYKVQSVQNNGIRAYPKGEGTSAFIYMGKVYYDNNLNITKRPHRIKILKKAERKEKVELENCAS